MADFSSSAVLRVSLSAAGRIGGRRRQAAPAPGADGVRPVRITAPPTSLFGLCEVVFDEKRTPVNLWLPTPLAPLAHKITFSVRMRPKGWTRANPFLKGGRMVQIVKNKEDAGWQRDYRMEFTRKMSRDGHLSLFPWKGPVIMANYFLYYPPGNWYEGKEKTSTPDDDNLAKQVADALAPRAKGAWGAFENDKQIIGRITSKFFHPKGDAVITVLYLFENVEKPKRGRQTKT